MINTAEEDTESIAEYRDGIVQVWLSGAYIAFLNDLGRKRNNSSGGTGKTHANISNEAVHQHGMGGEGGLHIAYDEYSLDEEIYHGRGDGGIDGILKLGGEIQTIDVKCPTYTDDPFLKVEAGVVESKSKEQRADAYVLATEEDGIVTYYGWISSEEFIQDEYKKEPYQRGATHMNYRLEDKDKLNPMPPLTVASTTLLTQAAE